MDWVVTGLGWCISTPDTGFIPKEEASVSLKLINLVDVVLSCIHICMCVCLNNAMSTIETHGYETPM